MLTDAERYIVRLVLAGHTSTKALAQTTQLSPHTVQTHVNSIYRKLDVHSRAELILLMFQQERTQI